MGLVEVQAEKFTLLRFKAAAVTSSPLIGGAFIAAVGLATLLTAFLMFSGDPLVMQASRELPRWCWEAGRFFNHFGNGYNIFVPLAAVIVFFTLTAPMKLSRAAHTLITALAVRAIFLLAAIGIPSLVSTLAKWIFGRVRPKLSQYSGDLNFSFFTWTYDGVGLSFPSGHTTVAFSAALAISTLASALRVPLFAVACLVGAARVVLGAHYPSDVVAGALCGTVVAALVSRAFARQRLGLVVTEKGAIEPKPWPRLSRFVALAGALPGKLRGRAPTPIVMESAKRI